MRESQITRRLFKQLCRQPLFHFPGNRNRPVAPGTHGVYIVRDPEGRVVHVGRTIDGKGGLLQRLEDHLKGTSSFAKNFLKVTGASLRLGYSFQYLEIADGRQRALVEALAAGWFCPAHFGTGKCG